MMIAMLIGAALLALLVLAPLTEAACRLWLGTTDELGHGGGPALDWRCFDGRHREVFGHAVASAGRDAERR